MAKHKRDTQADRERINGKLLRRGRVKAIAVLSVLLSLMASSGILAQRGILRSTDQRAKSADTIPGGSRTGLDTLTGIASPASLTPANPSKEYIYAGGRIVATEESVTTAINIETIGVYRPSSSTFYLRNSNSTGPPDLSIPYGAVGDLPVVGDWDGNGSTTIGLYRPSNSTFYLRNSNSTGVPDVTAPYGASGDIPLVGDWDGNGTTTIGVFRPSNNTFYLRNNNSSGFAELIVPYGASGDYHYRTIS